jgi:hypothetical protein
VLWQATAEKRRTAFLHLRFSHRAVRNKSSWIVFLHLTGVLSGVRCSARAGSCVITITTKLEPKDKFRDRAQVGCYAETIALLHTSVTSC